MAEGGANQLRANALGTAAITFLVISAAAPLTAAAGGVPLAMLLGNGAGVAGGFGIITLILVLFAVGYVAMARHVRNAGAFYAFCAKGLGGRVGGAAAMVAILSYNCMQIGVMGLLGAATATSMSALGINLPWWVWTYLAIAFVAVLGYRQVDLSARILIVLVALEYVVVLVIDAAILLKGGDSGLTLAPFAPSQVLSGNPAIGLLFCIAAFIGFEATTIYSEEARDPEVSVPRATYFSVFLIGFFYMATAWLMAVGVGVDNVGPTLQGLPDPTTFLFDLAARYVGGPIVPIMHLLFVTSLFAGVLAFHNGAARYKYVAGRDGLLPDGVGVTHPEHQSPHVGSVIQTVVAVVVVTIFVVQGLDPVLQLFTWLTQLGTLGILGLMAAASFAVVGYFQRNGDQGEGALATRILPTVAGAALALIFLFSFAKFGEMIGSSGWEGFAMPMLVPLAALVGYVLASRLRQRDFARFDAIGERR